MLGKYSRLNVLNSTGQTVTVTAKALRYKIGADGVKAAEESSTTIMDAASVANNTYVASTAMTNAAWESAELELAVNLPSGSPAAPNTVTVFLQRSLANSTWPDNGHGVVIKVFNFTGTGTQTDIVESA